MNQVELVAVGILGFIIIRAIESVFRKIGQSMANRKKKRQEAKLEQYEVLLQELEKRLNKRKAKK